MGLRGALAVVCRVVGMGWMLVGVMGCERVQTSQAPAENRSSPDQAPPPVLVEVPNERTPPFLRTGNDARFLSVAMDDSGWPTLMWKEARSGTAGISVVVWDGSDWTALGTGPAVQKGVLSSPVMTLDVTGRPVVAWTDGVAGMGQGVFVSRWDGHRWTALGNTASAQPGELDATDLSLVIDAEDKPVVAWVAREGRTRQVFVERWSGTDWRFVGAPQSGFEGPPDRTDHSDVSSTALTLDSTGQPVVVWHEWDPTDTFSSVFVRRWTGETWQPLGGPLNALGGVAMNPSIASAPDGTLYVAWTEADEQYSSHIYVRKWDGAQWTALDDPSALGGDLTAIEARIVTDPKGGLWVTWKGMGRSPISHLHVGRWTDSGWVLLPVPDDSRGPVDQPALASAGGNVFLGWLYKRGEGSAYSAFGQELQTSP